MLCECFVSLTYSILVLGPVSHTTLYAAANEFVSEVNGGHVTGVYSNVSIFPGKNASRIYSAAKLPTSVIMTTANVQTTNCSSRCSGNKLVETTSPEVSYPGTHAECVHCDCNKPHCESYGTCCPLQSYIDEYDIIEDSTQKQNNQTIANDTILKDIHHSESSYKISTEGKPRSESPEMRMQCDDYTLRASPYLYIRFCPAGYTNQTVRQLCQVDLPEHDQTMTTFARVYDNRTGSVFYNSYCAECHGVFQPTVWRISVHCEHYLHLYTARSQDELLRLSLQVNSLCYAQQEAPPGLTLHNCSSYTAGKESCHGEARRIHAGEGTTARHERCRGLSSRLSVPYERTPSQCYKNIVCSMCTFELKDMYKYMCSQDYASYGCSPLAAGGTLDSGSSGFKRVLPFSLLLGSLRTTRYPDDDHPIMTSKNCTALEWASPDGTCLRMHCAPGKFLSDGKCITYISQITGLGYRIRMLYIPVIHLTDNTKSGNRTDDKGSTEVLYLFTNYLQQQEIVNPAIAQTEMKVSYFLQDPQPHNISTGSALASSQVDIDTTNLNILHFFFYVEAYFIADDSIPRDIFENEHVTSFLLNVLEFNINGNVTVSLAPKLIPDMPNAPESLQSIPKDNGQRVLSETAFVCNKQHSYIWQYKQEFLLFSRVLTCVHVRFNESQFTVSVNCSTFPPTWHISLTLGPVEITFSEASDMRELVLEEDTDNGGNHLSVCLSLLQDKVKELKETVKWLSDGTVYLCLYYLTHICIAMSLLTLLITLVVYLLIASLRNEAGTNNMFLCGTLLLAQSSLLASSHVRGPSFLCTALGISTHFLWLSMIACSFLCCFHMFRVFTSKTGISKPNTTSQRTRCIKKTVAALLIPALIVAIVMISTYLTSGGERVGYKDSSPCYLDSPLLAVISLGMPLGVVTAANIYFFASTVYQIHNVKKLQTHASFKKSERRAFMIYIKLSSLTGVFWLMSIISEYTDNDPLRFVAIILNGLQGVFLFLSFVCTKRVVRLFFDTFLPGKRNLKTNIYNTTTESKEKTCDTSSSF